MQCLLGRIAPCVCFCTSSEGGAMLPQGDENWFVRSKKILAITMVCGHTEGHGTETVYLKHKNCMGKGSN